MNGLTEMSSSVAACWKDIEAWYKRHASVQFELLQKGTTRDQIANFEQFINQTLPEDYKESLLIHNGQPFLSSYQYLSLDKVKKRWLSLTDQLERGGFNKMIERAGNRTRHISWWDRAWIPFAEDSGGNLICLSLLGEDPAGIINWEVEEGPIPTGIVSFYYWLKQYRDDLYNGVYKVDDEGFITEK